ncbi:MAG: hypothetical protein ABR548_05005 [Actinomycetota bacterium]|nr:hypothetical protein [Actinomycetota bacterium]
MRRSQPSTLALAFTGAVGGHAITYALADAHGTRHLLIRTGHGYFGIAIAAAAIAGPAVFAARVIAALKQAHGEAPDVKRLFAAQLTIFLVVECLERLAAGASFSTLMGGGVLAIGVASQIFVAGVLGLGLRVIGQSAVKVRPVATSCQPVFVGVAFRRFERALVMRGGLVSASGTRGPPPR